MKTEKKVAEKKVEKKVVKVEVKKGDERFAIRKLEFTFPALFQIFDKWGQNFLPGMPTVPQGPSLDNATRAVLDRAV